MSGDGEYLLLDIGNSRAKYATYAEQKLSQVEVIEGHTDLRHLMRGKSNLVISAVKRSELLDRIVMEAEHAGVGVYEVKTEPYAFGLKCAYENCSKLGVDRWLSMLALHSGSEKPFAVMDLGTASTCDFVVGDQHLGGWIAPGYDLMRSSLVSNTFQVTADQEYPNALALGNTTESCVNQGCLAYIQGMVSSAERKLAEISDDYHLYIDGGSHGLLEKLVDTHITIAKDLVFKGLIRYAHK